MKFKEFQDSNLKFMTFLGFDDTDKRAYPGKSAEMHTFTKQSRMKFRVLLLMQQ